MFQRQSRRFKKGELQTHYSSSRPGGTRRAYSTPTTKYQWVSSTKVRGRGGDGDNAGLPPLPPSDPHSSINARFCGGKKSDGQGGQSTVPAISESNAVRNAPFEKFQLSGSSDASVPKPLDSHTLGYRKRDAQIVSEDVSPQSREHSLSTRTPLRDGASSQASLQFGSLQDFANEMKVSHNASERETCVSTSITNKLQQNEAVEQTANGNPQLQPRGHLEQSKNETCHLQDKAKRYIHLNDNSSISGETDKSSITNKQLPLPDHDQSDNKNPDLPPMCDLKPSKNENSPQPKGNVEQCKSETSDLQPKDNSDKSKSQTPNLRPQIKRYIRVQQKFSKLGATAPMSSASNRQERKQYMEKPNARPPQLKAGEDYEESKDDVLHPQPMVKRYIQVQHNVFKPEVTVSTSHISQRLQQEEDLKQSREEALHLYHEAERDTHNKGVSAATVVTSTQDVVRAVPEVSVANSSFHQTHNFSNLSKPGPRTWTDGMSSTSFQMPVQLPSGSSSQVPESPFIHGLQPFPLQHQGLMHYDTIYSFSPNFGQHLASQFGSFDGITSNYMHNYLKKPTSRTPVKITHPDTNEELILDNSANRRLDGGSSGTTAHHFMALQPQSVAYGPSHLLNYFSHALPNSLSFQSSTSVPFRSSQMPSITSRLGFNSSDVHDVAVATNARNPSLAPIPVSKQDARFAGKNKAPLSIRSSTNERNQAAKPMDLLNVGCQPGKSKYHSKGFVQQPKSVAWSSLMDVPLRSSSAAISVDGVPPGKSTSMGINDKGIAAVSHQDATAKELQDLSKKYDFKSDKLPQAETSDFADNCSMKSSEIGKCCGNTLSPSKKIPQSDTVWGSPLSSQPIIPGSSKLEMINLGANLSVVDSCKSSLAGSEVCSPAAQAGFPCTSVGVCGQVQTGKGLIHGASSKLISRDISVNNAVSINNAQKIKYAPSVVQVVAKTKDSSEQGANLFEPTFVDSICKDGCLNNLGTLQVNQQSVKVPPIAETSACAEHAISGFEQDALQGSVEMWKSVSGKTGDTLVTDASLPSHLTDFTLGSPTLDSSLVYPEEPLSLSNEVSAGANENVKGKTELQHQKSVEISNELEMHQNVRHAALDDVESRGRKKYSRNFLLKLSEQFIELPMDLQFANDLAEGLIIAPKDNIARIDDHNSRSSYLRNMDGCAGSSSLDHHGRRKDGHHRWKKSPNIIETEQHFGFNGESSSFHPGRGGTYNRNLRGQVHSHYATGTSAGLLPHPATQGGRTCKRADVKKVLIFSELTLEAMHKAEKKYEVHKAIDAEETKQRQLKAILNKLTPQNFDRLFQQLKEVNIDNAITLAGLISQIFDKALMEPTFCEMYANFCYHLANELPDFVEGHEKITFKRLLLNKCQEEFERGEREQAEADRTDRDEDVRLSEVEREEKRIHARRRMLGNIRLIGELYKKKMLTERIMHECIEKLFRNDQFPEEEDIEALCKLMCTIGDSIDHPKAKEHMDSYFETMWNLSNNTELSTRMRFMLKDVIDLRKNKWQQRIKVEGPKKIDELHSDVAQERRVVGNQQIYTPRNSSSNKRVPTASGSQPSNFRSQKPKKAASCAVSSKNQGFSSQDVRLDERKLYQHGKLSVPFLQRSADDNVITVGLHRGFTKGMPLKDPTMFYSSPLTNSHTGFQESRKVPADPNGHSSIPEFSPFNDLKQQLMPKYSPDVFMRAPVYNPSNHQEHYLNRGSTSVDGSLGRSLMSRKMIFHSKTTLSSKVPLGKGCSDEYLREKSVAAIQEFYCAGNENEVFSCVGNLNSPSFYPSMVSIWVKDSFDRKDKERDLLAGLFVSLTESRAGVLTTRQLIKGFELVLGTLEVALTDAAKAAVFLGKLFGKIVTRNVISLEEIKRMVQQYAKAPDQSPQNKLGYEVMKIAFETIKLERGESFLNEMCKRFNVQLDDFRPSTTLKP